MQTHDLIRMCMQNLMRRKSRTLLTVLGVLIGCCSIVIMVSIGIGMKESQQKMLSEMGDLTIITVYPQSGGKQGAKLNDKAIAGISTLPGVEAATPRISAEDISFRLYAGSDRRYLADYGSAAGVNADMIEKLGFKLLEGEPFPPAPAGAVASTTESYALAGQYFEYSFKDTMRPDGYNTVDLYSMYREDGTVGEPPPAYFSAIGTPLVLEVTLGEGGKTLSFPIAVTGRVKEDYSKGNETSQGLILDSKALLNILAQVKKASGAALDANPSYASALIKVTDIGKVAEVEKNIKKQGFRTESMESIREPMEKEARQKQLMLGGLGAISLFVAALGITNTMIMSISERTKEIGIMKSLGCYVRDIRAMFLLEAGAIGLIGGLVGCVVSLIASIGMNLISAGSQNSIASLQDALAALSATGSRISVIPPWLGAFAIMFSVFIGLGSGYYPANKAVGIPAIEAIKQD